MLFPLRNTRSLSSPIAGTCQIIAFVQETKKLCSTVPSKLEETIKVIARFTMKLINWVRGVFKSFNFFVFIKCSYVPLCVCISFPCEFSSQSCLQKYV